MDCVNYPNQCSTVKLNIATFNRANLCPVQCWWGLLQCAVSENIHTSLAKGV